MPDDLPGWITPAVLVGALLAFTATETLAPLRRRVEPRVRRFARNAAVGGLGYVVLGLGQILALASAAAWIEARGLGFLRLVELPAWLALAAGILLLDWTLWIWHVLNHRVRFLWRFHSVHHVDLDLDASTGLRFHFGELAFALGVRSAQLALIGPTPLAVGLWQALLTASVFFHHSNTRLPLALERVLVRFVATPRMHGIHHSIVDEERDSNFASLLTLWDRLHGTLRLGVPQPQVVIGVPGRMDSRGLTLGKILVQPFRRQPSGSAPSGTSAPPRPGARLAG